MNKNDVTKRGRPRQHKSNAERQQAYRQRRKACIKARDDEARLKALCRTHNQDVDTNRMINETVQSLRTQFLGLEMLGTRQQLVDRTRLPEWIASLKERRRDLNRFIRFLKKL